MLVKSILCVLLLLCMLSGNSIAKIGTVATITGSPGEISRGKARLPGSAGATLESDDIITTRNGVANLKFADDSTVKVNENSRLLIDSFVYDPNKSDSSKLVLRVGLGAVRYASGQIAKVNPQQVSVKTPTATISVRGTDMSMIVDESGRSLVVLLPSCRDDDVPKQYELDVNRCRVGKISVSTLGGTVELERAFEAVLVSSNMLSPSRPVILNTIENNVTINLLISPPQELSKSNASDTDKSKETEEIHVSSAKRNTKHSSDKSESVTVLATTEALPLTNTTSTMPGASYKQTGTHSATIVVENADALIATCDTISLVCISKDDVRQYDTTVGILNNGTNPIVPAKTLTVARTSETWEHIASVRVSPNDSPHHLTIVQNDSTVSLQIGNGVDANIISINQRGRR